MNAIFYLYDAKPIDFYLDTGEHIYLSAGDNYFIEPGILNYDFNSKPLGPSYCIWLVPGYWRDN